LTITNIVPELYHHCQFFTSKIDFDIYYPIATCVSLGIYYSSMLTNEDVRKIKGLLQPLEGKIDKLGEQITDLRLETKAIHKIIETQGAEFEKRIVNLEDQVGIN